MKYPRTATLITLLMMSCTAEPQSNASQSTQEAQQESQYEASGSANRVSDAQERLRNRNQTPPDVVDAPRYELNVEPYSYFLNEQGYLELVGVTDNKLDEILGSAPVVVRQAVDGAPLRREVRVYLPYEEDSTGLFIYIRNNRVERFRMDTFLGLANSTLIQDYFQN